MNNVENNSEIFNNSKAFNTAKSIYSILIHPKHYVFLVKWDLRFCSKDIFLFGEKSTWEIKIVNKWWSVIFERVEDEYQTQIDFYFYGFVRLILCYYVQFSPLFFFQSSVET